MKFKNVKIGQKVKVKSGYKNQWFYYGFEGKVGTVVDTRIDDVLLNVRVDFEHTIDGFGCEDWGNHKDLKLVKDVDLVEGVK